jgi:2-hydroxyacyl-CoA lyase 1
MVIEKAVRVSTYGRPGVCYVDIPADFVNEEIPCPPILEMCAPPPLCLADPNQVAKAVELLIGAKNPLFIIGKG